MINIEPSEQPSILFGRNSLWLTISLLTIFLLAALIRRDEIQAPGFGLTREYTSAIIARAYYFNDNDKIDSWRQNIAKANKSQQPILEPPITEYLTSLLYRIIGNEKIWHARYLTISFWLIGGVYMYKTA